MKYYEKKNALKFELFLGIVAPIGTEKDKFLESLKEELITNDYNPIDIEVTTPFIDMKCLMDDLPKSLIYFLKMQICSELRSKTSPGILVLPIVSSIIKKREKNKDKKKIIYIIDQLKNAGEHKILKHIYGMNYIQVSLFSNEGKRDHYLEKTFDNGMDLHEIADKDE